MQYPSGKITTHVVAIVLGCVCGFYFNPKNPNKQTVENVDSQVRNYPVSALHQWVNETSIFYTNSTDTNESQFPCPVGEYWIIPSIFETSEFMNSGQRKKLQKAQFATMHAISDLIAHQTKLTHSDANSTNYVIQPDQIQVETQIQQWKSHVIQILGKDRGELYSKLVEWDRRLFGILFYDVEITMTSKKIKMLDKFATQRKWTISTIDRNKKEEVWKDQIQKLLSKL